MREPTERERREHERERIVITGEQARQGEIILGKRGRWIWIGSFVVLLILILLGFA